jgi:hypothetical protein
LLIANSVFFCRLTELTTKEKEIRRQPLHYSRFSFLREGTGLAAKPSTHAGFSLYPRKGSSTI